MTKNEIINFSFFSGLSKENSNHLNQLWNNGGILKGKFAKGICEELAISIDDLMLFLLPIAESFSVAPISAFKVGAVVMGASGDLNEQPNLYLGANFEFNNLSLNFSIHAEQSAISNAWLNAETTIKSIATSAAPCGHCRQFLYEVSGENSLTIVMPESAKNQNVLNDIQSLLPCAFGPKELNCEQRLMQIYEEEVNLELVGNIQDDLVLRALEQAKLSYAPYTKNYAACLIELRNGTLLFGRYAENAAHNPSLSAFSSAVSQLSLHYAGGCELGDYKCYFENEIKRVILVENPTSTSQREYAKLLLSHLVDNLEIEYFQLKLI